MRTEEIMILEKINNLTYKEAVDFIRLLDQILESQDLKLKNYACPPEAY